MIKNAIVSFMLLAVLSLSAAEHFTWHRSEENGRSIFTLSVAENVYIDPASVVFTLKDRSGSSVVPAFDGTVPEKLTAGKWKWQTPRTGLAGKVEYQGCSNDGMCFMPQETVFDLPGPQLSAAPRSRSEKYELIRKAEGYMDKRDFMLFLKGGGKGFFGDAGLIGILLLTLLGGLGLNLTPCILPMVPVTLIVIGAKGGGAAGFRRGLAYGFGMAAAYGLLGLGAALLGIGFGSINSSPVFNFFIGAVFLVLALCMAGVFNFNFGASFRSSIGKFQGAALIGAFIMGVLAALLAGACVAPVVISVLIFVAREYNSGNSWALLLPFILGLGMALPWPLAGLGLSVLPKPGKFMLAVKYILALAVAGMACYYVFVGWKLLQFRKQEAAGNMQHADGFAALEAASLRSRKENKPMLVKFGASWCKNCHAMDNGTLKDPEVAAYIRDNFIPVAFQAENPNAPEIKALLQAWQIPGFPAFAIVRNAPEK